MGEFTQQVQNDKIAGPLRRKFTTKGWKQAFESYAAPDAQDKNVYEAALVIHEKLRSIRSRLKLSSSGELSATTKLRSFVAAVNHSFLVARNKSEMAISKLGEELAKRQPDGIRIEELASVKLKLSGGFEWTPAEVVESVVDGIQIPVRVALEASPDLSGNPNMGKVVWQDIMLELNLGIFYQHAEDLWEDCLWNSYELVDTGRCKVFLPKDIDLKSGYIMGLARRLSLSVGFTALATKYHRSLAGMGEIPLIREVHRVEREGKRQVISATPPKAPSKSQEQFLVSRVLASEPYYDELLEEPQSLLAGLSINRLLDAWNVVSQTAHVLVGQVSEKHVAGLDKDRDARAWLPEYAPVLQLEALIQSLSSVSGFNRAESRSLIEFLTYKGEAGQEIWAQPLIQVGVSTVAPVFSATTVPNLRRLVDVWLRQLGVDLARRGPAFEMYLRAEVQQGIRNSKVLSGHAWCIEHDYTFKPKNGREEQIDLVLAIGSTVIVAEAKCILEPTDSKAVAMHRRTVLHAAEQALRKSEAIEANRDDFLNDVKKFGFSLAPNFSVLPLVVVSTATHIGVPANGIPVVDEYILSRFLDGEFEDVAMMGEELKIKKTLKTIFYSDVEEAELSLGKYFNEPPQMKRFKKGLTGRVIPLHHIDDDDWMGMIFTLECIPKDVPASKVDVVEAV
ncbi:NERD domain-containing protein [Comamonas thiooxydans]|uniref:NERD domain-containing protein n=1 Tax=Comamonas thiooxydans TaxID=363952 RepID=UPI00071040D0|nr:NERD domain-containing protein [Comamonas thiooxydans]